MYALARVQGLELIPDGCDIGLGRLQFGDLLLQIRRRCDVPQAHTNKKRDVSTHE